METLPINCRWLRQALSIAVGMLFLLLAGLATRPALADVKIEAAMRADIDQMWANMPQSGDSPNCHLLEGTNEACAAHALRITKRAIAGADIKAGAWRSFKITVDVAKEVLGLYELDKVADVVELIMNAVDAESPQDYVKNMGQTLVEKCAALGAELLGEKSRYLNDDALYQKAVEKGAGKFYDWALKDAPQALLKKPYSHPACGDITMTFWIARGTNGKVELHMSANGGCDCKIPDGDPVKLGNFSIHAVAPLRATKIGSGDTSSLELGLSGSAEYWIQASCDCRPTATPEAPATPSDEKFQPTNEFTQADMDCTERSNSAMQRMEMHAAFRDFAGQTLETARKDIAPLRLQFEAKSAELFQLQSAAEEARKILATPLTGAATPAQREALVNAPATIHRLELSQLPRELSELRDQIAAASPRIVEQSRKLELHKSQARHWQMQYEQRLRECITDACRSGLPFGTGATRNKPPFGDRVQRDLQAMKTRMEQEEKFDCEKQAQNPADERAGNADAAIEGNLAAARIREMMEEVNAEWTKMSNRYGYGKASQTTLKEAMERNGVVWAQRYLDSWPDSLYLRWDSAGALYSRARDALQSSLAMANRLGKLPASDMNYLEQGMSSWRVANSTMQQAFADYADAMALNGLEMDRYHADRQYQGFGASEMVGQRHDRIIELCKHTSIFGAVGGKPPSPITGAPSGSTNANLEHVGLIACTPTGEGNPGAPLIAGGQVRVLAKFVSVPAKTSRTAAIRITRTDGSSSVSYVSLKASSHAPLIYMSDPVSLATVAGDRVEASIDSMTQELVVRPK